MSKKKIRKVLDKTRKLWNAFNDLPAGIKHPDDTEDFRHHVHAIQNILYTQLYKLDEKHTGSFDLRPTVFEEFGNGKLDLDEEIMFLEHKTRDLQIFKSEIGNLIYGDSPEEYINNLKELREILQSGVGIKNQLEKWKRNLCLREEKPK